MLSSIYYILPDFRIYRGSFSDGLSSFPTREKNNIFYTAAGQQPCTGEPPITIGRPSSCVSKICVDRTDVSISASLKPRAGNLFVPQSMLITARGKPWQVETLSIQSLPLCADQGLFLHMHKLGVYGCVWTVPRTHLLYVLYSPEGALPLALYAIPFSTPTHPWTGFVNTKLATHSSIPRTLQPSVEIPHCPEFPLIFQTILCCAHACLHVVLCARGITSSPQLPSACGSSYSRQNSLMHYLLNLHTSRLTFFSKTQKGSRTIERVLCTPTQMTNYKSQGAASILSPPTQMK